MTRFDRADDGEPICDKCEEQTMGQDEKTSPNIPYMISNDPEAIGQQPGYKAKNNRQLQYEATDHYYRQNKINKVTKTKATTEQTRLKAPVAPEQNQGFLQHRRCQEQYTADLKLLFRAFPVTNVWYRVIGESSSEFS